MQRLAGWESGVQRFRVSSGGVGLAQADDAGTKVPTYDIDRG